MYWLSHICSVISFNLVVARTLLNSHRCPGLQASTFSFGGTDMDSTVKTAKKKGTGNKATDLNGRARVMLEKDSAPAEKQPLNCAKPEETSGSSMFADRRTRQPPGGDSSILLG